jgi:predicted nucleic acid-binding protein
MARERAWAEADDVLLADHAYVALAERSAVHLVGSDVRGLRPMPFGGGMVDLAVLGVDS